MDDAPQGAAETNGFDRAVTESMLKEIDDLDAQLASLKGEYMNACKGPRGDIADIFKAAKDKGLPMRAFRALVKNRRLDKKMAANVERLEDDDQANYDALVVGLGDFVDLPLGHAALRRARPGAEGSLDGLSA